MNAPHRAPRPQPPLAMLAELLVQIEHPEQRADRIGDIAGDAEFLAEAAQPLVFQIGGQQPGGGKSESWSFTALVRRRAVIDVSVNGPVS